MSSLIDRFSEIKKSVSGIDSTNTKDQPKQRKGLFDFVQNLIQKKQQKTFVLNATTLDRLAKTDPVTWAIIRTIKSKVNNTPWDIVPDTEGIEKELDRWEEYAIESLNPYGLQDKPFKSEMLDPELFDEVAEKLTKILQDTSLDDIKKARAIRWVFKSSKRQITHEAQLHCEQVRAVFDRPNNSAETSLRALQELILHDLLVYDAGIIIKNYSHTGKLAELYTVPGHEIKIYRNEDRTTPQPPEPAYVWEDSGIQRAEFTNDELIYVMLNPTQGGYGISALEVAAYVITASLFADQYNIDYFKNSNVPPGVFNLGENVTEEQRRLFQTLWDNEVQGRAGGLHRMLFMTGSDNAKFIPLQNLSNRDMQMMEYISWTVSVKCACYGLTPQDIGFTQDYKGMGSGGVAETQKDLTDSRGIRTILNVLEQYYNAEIVKSEFEFNDIKFKWLTEENTDNEKQSVIDARDIQTGVISRNERRNKLGLKPIPGGDIVTITSSGGLMPIENLEQKEEQTLQEEVAEPEQANGEAEQDTEESLGMPQEEKDPLADQAGQDPATQVGKGVFKTPQRQNLKLTVNKSLRNKKGVLGNVVQKLKDSGIDAELRIGFKQDDVTK